MAEYPGRHYVILESSEIDSVDFNLVFEDSKETVRYSVDNNYFFVKFEGDAPLFLDGKQTYTHYEIRQKMQDENDIWYRSLTEE